jgi:uncharacterized protein
MNGTGTFTTDGDARSIEAVVTDLRRLAGCLPGFDSVLSGDDSEIAVRVKVGVGPIKGSMDARITVVERLANGIRYKGRAGGLGSAVDVLASFDWSASGAQTVVTWSGDAQSSGKLAALAKGLVESIARKNIEALITNVQAALGGAAAM